MTNAFGVPGERLEGVPIVNELSKYSGSDLLELIRLRVLCFSKNTWISMLNGMRKYLDYCQTHEISTFPVDYNSVQLCLIEFVKKGKSIQVLENIVDSIIFCSNFIGWRQTAKDKVFKNMMKSLSKLAIRRERKVEGLESVEIKTLWDKVLSLGGVQNISLVELRTFMIV